MKHGTRIALSRAIISAVLASAGLGALGTLGVIFAPQSIEAQVSDPRTLPLVQRSDITYLGSFTVPSVDVRGESLTYGGNALGYNPVNNSLFFGCHDWYQLLAEVSIPNFGGTAQVLQPCTDVAEGHQVDGDTNGDKLSGNLVYGGRLITTEVAWYDADGTQDKSHGVSSNLDLSQTSNFQGFFPFTGVAAPPRALSGYMSLIPPEWRTLLGGPALTGQGAVSIIGSSSDGPAATVFDPAEVGNVPALHGTTLVFYPYPNSHPDFAAKGSLLGGVAFPKGSRSVLFFGTRAQFDYCYGTPDECPYSCFDHKGPHNWFKHAIWAYDVNDLLRVKSGELEPWQVMPYATWEFNDIDSGNCASTNFGGATFDMERGIFYVTEKFGENPAVHAFQIGTPIADLTAPTVSISAPANGTTLSGVVSVSADASDGESGVTSVEFFIDGTVSLGVDLSSPYQVSWDTRLSSNAVHTLTAKALNGAGLITTSAVRSVTVFNAPSVPTVAISPVSVSVGIGGTVTFTASAQGTIPITYQWQRNGVDIAGATALSYTTVPLALSDSGVAYRVRATNAAGSALSNAVPVTVTNAENIWGSRTTSSFNADNQPWELGMIFSPTRNGSAIGTRVYGAPSESGVHSVRLWRNTDGVLLSGPHSFTFAGQGWHEFTFPTPVSLSAGAAYTIVVSTGGDASRWYTAIPNDLVSGGTNGGSLTYPANAAVYSSTLGVRPTQSYLSENYLRDIIFAPASSDVTPPSAPIGLGVL